MDDRATEWTSRMLGEVRGQDRVGSRWAKKKKANIIEFNFAALLGGVCVCVCVCMCVCGVLVCWCVFDVLDTPPF